jgi:hypothetical protein
VARKVMVIFCTALIFLFLATARSAESAETVIYGVDFAGYAGGAVLPWLSAKGFVPKQDASNTRKVVYFDDEHDLVLATRTRAFALLLNETDVQGYSKIRIEWGVDIYPPGASYEKGVRAEAVMVYVFFGKERLSSGSLFIPDSPYFIGLFLCESESTGQAFTGRYFHAGGRFICVDRPPPGKLVTTEYPIAEAFTRLFGQNQAPDISGFGIAIDTNNAKGDGVARAFVRKIEFIK